MATAKAEDVGDGGVSLPQKMMSAVSGSILTSLLGESPGFSSGTGWSASRLHVARLPSEVHAS
jgi:hypothetical protein